MGAWGGRWWGQMEVICKAMRGGKGLGAHSRILSSVWYTEWKTCHVSPNEVRRACHAYVSPRELEGTQVRDRRRPAEAGRG